jgi:hypothetical protein
MDTSTRDNYRDAAYALPQGPGSRLDADTLRKNRPEDFVSSKDLYFEFDSGSGKWKLKVKYPSGTIDTLATEP